MPKAALWISIKASNQARQAYRVVLLIGVVSSALVMWQLSLWLGVVLSAVWIVALRADRGSLGAQCHWVAVHCAVEGDWHLWRANGRRVRVRQVCWQGPIWLGFNVVVSREEWTPRTVLIWPDMITPAERAALCRLIKKGQPN